MSFWFLVGCSGKEDLVYDNAFLYNPTESAIEVEIQRLETSDVDCDLLRKFPGLIPNLEVRNIFTQTAPTGEIIGLGHLTNSSPCKVYAISISGIGTRHIIVDGRRTWVPQHPASIVDLGKNVVVVRPGSDEPWSDGEQGIIYAIESEQTCEPTPHFGWELDVGVESLLQWGQALPDGCFALLNSLEVEVGQVCSSGHTPFQFADLLIVESRSGSIDLQRFDGAGLLLSHGDRMRNVVPVDAQETGCVYANEECWDYADTPFEMRLEEETVVLGTGDQFSWQEDSDQWDLFVIRSSEPLRETCPSGRQFILIHTPL